MKKTITGTIKKIIDQSTVKVNVLRFVRHPKYQKQFRVSKNFLVDSNKKSDLIVGQTIIIEEVRSISKRKSWRIV